MSRFSVAQPQHPEWQRGHTLESHFYLLSIWFRKWVYGLSAWHREVEETCSEATA